MENETPNPTSAVTPVSSTQPAPVYVTQTPATAPTSNPNQATIVALVFFLLLLTGAVIFLAFRSQPASNSAYDPELQALRSQVEQKRLALGLSADSDTSAGLTAESLTNRITSDANSLGGLLREITDRLAAKDRIIEQKNAEIDNAARARESLTIEIGTLTKKLEEARLSSAQNSSLLTDLEDAKMLLKSAQEQVRDLRARLSNAPTDSSLESLRTQLNLSQEEVDRLTLKLKNAAPADDLADLRSENRKLRLEMQELRSQLNRNRLFAEKAESLSPASLALYTRLTALEGHSNEERLQAYEQIQDELDARVVENVAFATGSSTIDVEKVNVIKNSLKSTAASAEYLVVGYASKSGDANTNREISSKRATTVATVTDLERGDNQTVKGVFLGQTNRFSSTNDYSNQICEIWEIKPN